MESNMLPAYFISHGGGPWPWIKEMAPHFSILEKFLREIPGQLKAKPKAILMISGHWEEKEFTVMTNPNPPMLYDYGGFPEHTYQIKYSATGSPMVADRVKDLLLDQGIPVLKDSTRGFDHGAFAPLYVMYPKADVPVVQLSLKKSLDPEEHLQVGKALRQLRKEGVLIIGSGLSFHNLRLMDDIRVAATPSLQFDTWLQNTVISQVGEARNKELINWKSAPFARVAHPREEHLIPLMVTVGAAETDPVELCHHEKFLGAMTVSSFKFGR